MRFLLFSAALLLLGGCEQHEPTPWQWQLPPGLPAPQVPDDNALTVEKAALGKALFFDARLSANEQQSCASCHQPALAFSDGLQTAVGSTGEVHRRNSLALVNVGYNATLTWAHPGLTTLEQQILIPLFGEEPLEMGVAGHGAEVLARFRQDERYERLFAMAWPAENNAVTFDTIVKSLASYVRTLVSFDSPFDRYAFHGEDAALSEGEVRGLNLFLSERLECHHCHGGFNFSQSTTHANTLIVEMPFHNTGLHNLDGRGAVPTVDTGLMEHTRRSSDMGKFRAPTLRNIALTAPYMHDGSLASLEEVLDFYAAGGRVSAATGDGRASPVKNAFVKGFTLTEHERDDVLAFLASLSDAGFVRKGLDQADAN